MVTKPHMVAQEGEQRAVTRFMIFPKNLPINSCKGCPTYTQTRWMCWASVRQIYFKNKWYDVCWND